MSEDETAVDAVNGILARLVFLLRSRDLVQIMNLFTEDAILFGSEAQEVACGPSELQAFFESILTQPVTVLWTWDVLHVRQGIDTTWFVGPAVLHLLDELGGEQVCPYRLSGVLTRSPNQGWLFSMFNGSEPAAR